MNDLPSLTSILREPIERARGIDSWEHAALVGRGNIERLVQLAQETVYRTMTEGGSRDELRDVRKGIDHLQSLLPSAVSKPLLPRLRAESFREGDAVRIYVGYSKGCIAPAEWVPATITELRKAHKPEWVNGTPNSGYYWRSTATAAFPIFPDQRSLAFSTSEPRVLLVWEFDYLRRACQHDPEFLAIFAANAQRRWCPIWCLEQGISCAGDKMDMKAWLREGSALE